jgi:hypothetical protein
MEYSMLIALDGNSSLKQVGRKRYENDSLGKKVAVENIERETGKVFRDDIYLTEEEVNEFQYEVKHQRGLNKVRLSFSHFNLCSTKHTDLCPQHTFSSNAWRH